MAAKNQTVLVIANATALGCLVQVYARATVRGEGISLLCICMHSLCGVNEVFIKNAARICNYHFRFVQKYQLFNLLGAILRLEVEFFCFSVGYYYVRECLRHYFIEICII